MKDDSVNDLVQTVEEIAKMKHWLDSADGAMLVMMDSKGAFWFKIVGLTGMQRAYALEMAMANCMRVQINNPDTKWGTDVGNPGDDPKPKG